LSSVSSARSDKPKTKLLLIIFLILFSAYFVYYYFVSGSSDDLADSSSQKITSEELREAKNEDFALYIEKIDILAPVIFGVDGTNQKEYLNTLEHGVAHFDGTSLPGQGGNIFIFGHSSTQSGKGPYARVFEDIDILEIGDNITTYYQGEQFDYIVREKKIVAENNLSVLKDTSSEQLTLMTCWPIGTDEKRIVIIADPKNQTGYL
jgi:LPXTG-site transpeptidase (sortase) family protein